jgi:hypothetical protein
MPECLPNQSQIHIACDQMTRQRVLQDVRMPLLGWQASGFGNRLEQAKEGCAIKAPALLRCEEEI